MDYDLTPTQELLDRLIRRQGMWNADEVTRVMDEKFPDHPEWKEIALDAMAAAALPPWDNDAYPNNPERPVYVHQDFDPQVTQEFMAVLLHWYGMGDTRILATGFGRPDWMILARRALMNNPLSDDVRSRIQP